MDPNTRALSEVRLFYRLAFISCAGFLFYYAHIFFGFFDNVLTVKVLSIVFLLAAVPLPVIVMNNRKLFPGLRGTSKAAVNVATLLLLCHHFLMTFVFVMILQGTGAM